MKQNETCYMCDEEATTVEHVPPKCFFLPGHTDGNLIKVPSCAEHNNDKSDDDEYLRNTFTMLLGGNSSARQLMEGKTIRALRRNRKALLRYVEEREKVRTVNKEGKIVDTATISVEWERLDRSLDNITRAIYFYHYKKKYIGVIGIHTEFVGWRNSNPRRDASILNDGIKKVFEKVSYYGEYPEIFTYQVVDEEQSIRIAFRFHFYEGLKVFSILYGVK